MNMLIKLKVLCWSNVLSKVRCMTPLSTCHLSSATCVDIDANRKRSNIILMGSPGSGKTTVGRLLGPRLGKNVIDMDNDFLESHWGMTVSKKLDQVGDDNFVEEEGKATLVFSAADSVISLTGSNPMYRPAIDKLKSLGTVVFLDVKNEDILLRLERMKVDRIIGQMDNVPMADILAYRQQFYEGNYDIRILCEENESAESIAEKILKSLEERSDTFKSTRNGSTARGKSFNDVVLEGLAPDGGLYIPEKIPTWTIGQWARLLPLDYSQRALRILEAWIHPSSIHPSILAQHINDTYTKDNFDCHKVFPVVHLHDNHYVGELFRGPTASFKDAALQLMPNFFHHAMDEAKKEGKLDKDTRFLILVATSGDTGGAVLYGFNALNKTSDGTGVSVMVLYPQHGISGIQRTQMTTVQGRSLHVVGVDSDFDFCQTAIKEIFRDEGIVETLWKENKTKLSAANSINWGRLLPQVVYHGSLYLDLVAKGTVAMGEPVDVCIPTGNFGNILAAYYAKRMGVPIRRLICASNDNNVLTDFVASGSYDLRRRPLKVTASPAIDILRSSNLERYLFHTASACFSGSDAAVAAGELVARCYNSLDADGVFSVPAEVLSRIQQEITVDWCTEQTALAEINTTFRKTGYVLDPHTAVGRVAALRHSDVGTPMMLCSTAHPAKFADEVLVALGVNMEQPGKQMEQPRKQTEQQPEKQTPQELLEQLEGVQGARPMMHHRLERAVRCDIVHTRTIPAQRQAVVEELIDFARRRD